MHTVIVLNSGSKAEDDTPEKKYVLGERLLENGIEGDDVKELQTYLIQLGYDCGRYGIDGEFGDSTEIAVRNFQRDNNLEVDGQFGEKSYKKMIELLHDDPDIGNMIKIVNGNCYVRTGASTKYSSIGVAHIGEQYKYANETTIDGWNKIIYNNAEAYVSGKYSVRV